MRTIVSPSLAVATGAAALAMGLAAAPTATARIEPPPLEPGTRAVTRPQVTVYPHWAARLRWHPVRRL